MWCIQQECSPLRCFAMTYLLEPHSWSKKKKKRKFFRAEKVSLLKTPLWLLSLNWWPESPRIRHMRSICIETPVSLDLNTGSKIVNIITNLRVSDFQQSGELVTFILFITMGVIWIRWTILLLLFDHCLKPDFLPVRLINNNTKIFLPGLFGGLRGIWRNTI